MHMLNKRTVRVAALSALTLFAVLIVAGTVSAASKATSATLTIWSDSDRKAAVERVAGAWGRSAASTSRSSRRSSGASATTSRRCRPTTRPT